MLLQRVITAVVLLAILLPALFASNPMWFALLTLAMIAAGGWEWSRLNGKPGAFAIGFGAVLAAACAATLYLLGFAVPAWCWWLAGGLWVLGGVRALAAGVAGWPRLDRTLRLVLGAVLLWAAWLALVVAKQRGINFLLSAMCLVWMADIAAYFAGKAFGRRKLAPAISPGKSWEGAIGGLVGVIVLGFVWVHVIDARVAVDSASMYTVLVQRLGIVAILALVFLSAMSVVGDLFESLVKRAAGAKDSSQLLPGHGGVLDRVDALLPVLPLALALTSL
ncbi:MAG: phosphatidate cytidylyltransferase [Mitsuaria chitosanitabida]|uniref:phosphatidate cytidylyltransferase n=1 Tax=Roseateles chitosanitabidus TaxID=65048 RepID=UPI001B088D83|nr:phosphatidate cytidylyltransferase [Roseateles chitosanitabidus]MBO9687328.1 phosphatidate cytidylyltransferase [Roseateles chitosanitabidus]